MQSLPSLIHGFGQAKTGLQQWRAKVAAHKKQRHNTRQYAINQAIQHKLITTKQQHNPNLDDDELDDDELDDTDLRYEGDLTHYNDDSLLQREHLRTDHGVVSAINHWWSTLVLPLFDDNEDGTIQQDEYSGLYRLLLQALTQLFHLKQKKSGKLAEEAMQREQEEEWAKDSAGQTYIDQDRFCTVIFELVDIWCDHITASSYVALTNEIFTTIQALNLEQNKQQKNTHKHRKRKVRGPPRLSQGVGDLRYKSFDAYQCVLKREKERDIAQRKLQQTWTRGISRLKANTTMRLLIKKLKQNGQHEMELVDQAKTQQQRTPVEETRSGTGTAVVYHEGSTKAKQPEQNVVLVHPATRETKELMDAAGTTEEYSVLRVPSIPSSPSSSVVLNQTGLPRAATSKGFPGLSIKIMKNNKEKEHGEVQRGGAPANIEDTTSMLRPWVMPANFIQQVRRAHSPKNTDIAMMQEQPVTLNVNVANHNQNSFGGRKRNPGEKKNRKKRLKRPKSAGNLRKRRSSTPRHVPRMNRVRRPRGVLNVGDFGRMSGTLSMKDLKKFIRTKGKYGNKSGVRHVAGTRLKENNALGGVEGDGILTRQHLYFMESFGGIRTRMTTATSVPKLR